jgi:UDP-hydrolysing UDP-N-acetyl-D-glucosamine 2-epimerase
MASIPRVIAVTTARSDASPSSFLHRTLKQSQALDFGLLVGGAHLLERQGNTVRHLEAAQMPIVGRLPFLREEEGTLTPEAAARALREAASAFEQLTPDLVLLYGDRIELLPIANAALLTHTPIGHLCGGDVTEGAMDDAVRHAVTKLSHLHFPATATSQRRILAMGEMPSRVHLTGDPALDVFVRGPRASDAEVVQRLGFLPNEQTILVTVHPETVTGGEGASKHAETVCAALLRLEGDVIITAPAPDPGFEALETAFRTLVSRRPRTHFVPSLGSEVFRAVAARCGLFLGNSSSGLIEAPAVQLPVVNLGHRQHGRERGHNVIDCPFDATAMLAAIERARSETFRRSLEKTTSPYGDGYASERIRDVLSALPSRAELLHKKFSTP